MDISKLSDDDLKKLYKKHKITAKKYMGDDVYSWAVFENGRPKMTGISKFEVNYYKKQVLKMTLEKGRKI